MTNNEQRASMGPGVFTPGRGGDVSLNQNLLLSFNGAGRFHARKEVVQRPERRFVAHASMGPGVFTPGRYYGTESYFGTQLLQWGRAFSRPEGLPCGSRPCCGCSFNGAGRFHARKAATCVGCARHWESLQWGRAFSRPEGWTSDGSRAGSIRFNGAGRFHARKARAIRRYRRTLSGFNGAGRFHARKDQGRADWCPHNPASMGPGVFTPGRTIEWNGDGQLLAASMGPGVFTPGRRNLDFWGIVRYKMLQWGRAFSRPEGALQRTRQCTHCEASMGPGVFTPGRGRAMWSGNGS